MIKLGITGGIASGKSVVSKILESMSIPVYLTDDRAKDLMVKDKAIIDELKVLMGPNVYSKDGSLNKKIMADAIFSDPAKAVAVSKIVHPRVKEDFVRWTSHFEHESVPIVAMECAILVEANFIDAVDVSLLVYAPKEVRIRRAMLRDNTTRELVERRINAQFSEEDKMKKVDYSILNDGHSLVLPQLMNILERRLHIPVKR